MPSRVRSSTYRPAPVSSRRSSFLGGEAPIIAKRVYMVGLDLVRRDVQTLRLRWKLTAASVPANLAGALAAFSYFHFIDSQALPAVQVKGESVDLRVYEPKRSRPSAAGSTPPSASGGLRVAG